LRRRVTVFQRGQKVIVVTDKVSAYEATIVAVAMDDAGNRAYKVALEGSGIEQLGQWHKASDIFIQEDSAEDEQASWDEFVRR
jgi:hypothetical protein